MPIEVVMPRLSDTMEEGTVAKWLKQVGDPVSKGDILAEIETDKATMEMEAYDSGVLQEILVPEGETVPLGQTIAIIGEGGARAAPAQPAQPAVAASRPAPDGHAAPPAPGLIPSPDESDQAPVAAEVEAIPESGVGQEEAEAAASARVKASPLARHLAALRGINLAGIRGTGPHGRIVKADVEAAAQAPLAGMGQLVAQPGRSQAGMATMVPGTAPRPQTEVPAAASAAAEEPRTAPPPPAAEQAPAVAAPAAEAPRPVPAPAPAADSELVDLSRMRQTVARRMVESATSAPHFYVTVEVDMREAVAWVKRLRELDAGNPEAPKLSYNDLILKAVALALQQYPDINASFRGNQVEIKHRINIGIAVAMPHGLIVPVLHDADRKTLRQIAAESRALAQRARDGRPQPQDFQGGTFTVSNLGMYDVDQFTAVINQPESAILAVGAIKKRPLVVGDELVVAETVRLTLSSDHRVIYGADAAEFLRELKRLLEQPLYML